MKILAMKCKDDKANTLNPHAKSHKGHMKMGVTIEFLLPNNLIFNIQLLSSPCWLHVKAPFA
jgi:hypothetical protein